MSKSDEIALFLDDTGSRESLKVPDITRRDGMDCYGLGGILIDGEHIGDVARAHSAFCAQFDITYPLHSHKIRGGREEFAWLKNPEKGFEFLSAMSTFLCELPVIGLAAIIDRPGYVARYAERHTHDLWYMDRTAYPILIERAALYAQSRGRRLRVYFEQCGKTEDREILRIARSLKTEGSPFRSPGSQYAGLNADDFKGLILGEPKRQTKQSRPMQIADLYLYPMAKGGYDPTYRPYAELKAAGRLIDTHLDPAMVATRGIKYSCFDDIL